MGGFNTGQFNTFPFGGGGTGGQGLVQVSEIIYAAYRNIGILGAPQRGYSPSELADGIEALNTMLDAWQVEPLRIYSMLDNVFNLTPGKQKYTIGIDPTGAKAADFSVARPVWIHAANLLTQIAGSSITRVPMEILSVDGWSQIQVQDTGSSIPQKLYDDYAYPLSTLYLWPYPNAAGQLELYTWQQFAKFVTDGDTVLVPPGYLRALKFNLAVELGVRNPKRGTISEALMKLAIDSLATIEAHNSPSPLMSCDLALLGGKKLSFNYLVGE